VTNDQVFVQMILKRIDRARVEQEQAKTNPEWEEAKETEVRWRAFLARFDVLRAVERERKTGAAGDPALGPRCANVNPNPAPPGPPPVSQFRPYPKGPAPIHREPAPPPAPPPVRLCKQCGGVA
jgi:hypothetical protein